MWYLNLLRQKVRLEQVVLLFVLMIAVFFRFNNFFQLPYTHDELSALNRLEFNSISDLLKYGVKPDGHPALIQVFLFYWVKIFNNSEVLVKIPFLLLGIASVYLVYKISVKWFGLTIGVFSSIFMATSQYFIIYSQYARPYISGCFFSLLMYHFLLIVIFGDKIKLKHWFFLSISILLCSLNHHISMLTAFVACAGALLFMPRNRVKTFLLFCFFSVLAYLPHLPITLSQFLIGGVGGWLSPPEYNFILKFFYFLIHYSPIMIGVLIFIFLFNFILVKKSMSVLPNNNRIRLFLILNFIMVWLICQFYSVFRNPVLQYSTLIFSTPLLIIFLFSYLKEASGLKLLLPLILLISGMSFTLSSNRKFFELNYNQGFERVVLNTSQIMRQNSNAKIAMIVRSEPWFINYYFKKYKINIPVLYQPNDRQLTQKEIKDFITEYKASTLLCLNLEPQNTAFAASFSYQLNKKEIGYSYEIYIFKKKKSCESFPIKNELIESYRINFSELQSYVNFNKQKIKTDSLGQKYLRIDSSDLYPIGISLKLNELNPKIGDHLLLKIKTGNSEKNLGTLFFNITNGDSSVFYSDNKLSENNFCRTNFSSMFYGLKSNENHLLTAGFFNDSKKSLKIYEFTLFLLMANPYRYALLDEILD